MRRLSPLALGLSLVSVLLAAGGPTEKPKPRVMVTQTDKYVQIDTDAL